MGKLIQLHHSTRKWTPQPTTIPSIRRRQFWKINIMSANASQNQFKIPIFKKFSFSPISPNKMYYVIDSLRINPRIICWTRTHSINAKTNVKVSGKVVGSSPRKLSHQHYHSKFDSKKWFFDHVNFQCVKGFCSLKIWNQIN